MRPAEPCKAPRSTRAASRRATKKCRPMKLPASKALAAVLAATSGANVPLGYTISEGTVVISTKEDLQSTKYQTVRVYDVRDLLGRNLNDVPAMYALQMYGTQAETLIDTVR